MLHRDYSLSFSEMGWGQHPGKSRSVVSEWNSYGQLSVSLCSLQILYETWKSDWNGFLRDQNVSNIAKSQRKSWLWTSQLSNRSIAQVLFFCSDFFVCGFTDWEGLRNLVSLSPRTLQRFVLVSSIGVTKSNELPWRCKFFYNPCDCPFPWHILLECWCNGLS